MFRISLNTKEIDGLAVRLARRSTDFREAMTEIEGIMLGAVAENFEKEGRPTWTPLAKINNRFSRNFYPQARHLTSELRLVTIRQHQENLRKFRLWISQDLLEDAVSPPQSQD